MSMFTGIRPQLSSGVSTLTTNVIMSTGSTRQESEINLNSVNQETNTFKCQKVNTTMATGRTLNTTLPASSSSSGTTVCVGKSHGPNLSLTFLHPKYKFMEMRLPLLSSLEEPDGNLLHIVLDENGLLENKRIIFEQKNIHIQAFMKLEDAEQFKKDRTIIKCPQKPTKSKNETMAEKCAVDDFQTLIDLFTNCMDEETREYNKFAQRMFFLSEKGTENLLQKEEYENLVDFYELPQGPIAIGKKPTGEWCIACVKADKTTPGKDVDGTGSTRKSGSSNLTIKSITRNFYVGSSNETFQTSSSQVYGNNSGPQPCGNIVINRAACVQGPQVFGNNVLNQDASNQECSENNHSNQTSQVYIDDGIIYQVKEEPEDSDYERGENSTRDQASNEETTKRETRIGTQYTYIPIKRKAEEEERDVNMYIYPSTSSDVQQDQEMSENTEDSLGNSTASSNEQQPMNREAKNKRFKFVTAEEMQELQQRKISASTMKNTKWGVNIFQGSEKMDQLEIVPSVEETATSYACIHCPFSSKWKSNLTRHQLKHNKATTKTNANAFTCTVKGNKKRFVCDQCGKSFRSRYGMNVHNKIKHLNKFRFSCAVCKRGFHHLWNFKGHLASHHKQLEERCQVCGATFRFKSSLLVHARQCKKQADSNDNPTTALYKCQTCDAIFQHRKNLSDHIQGQHGERVYRCEKCGKSFKWRSSLSYHTRFVKQCDSF